MAEKFLREREGGKGARVPVLSKQEERVGAEKRLLNYLDRFHKGQVLPDRYEKAMLRKAVEIYDESKENAEKRFEYLEKKGVLPSKRERVKIWQNEYFKSMVAHLNALVKKDAEKRVDKVIAGLESKEKGKAEKNREKYVYFMQNYLARNPNFLFESEAKESAAKVIDRVLTSLEGKDREDFLKIKNKLAKNLEKYFLENPRRLKWEESRAARELNGLRNQVKELNGRIAELESQVGEQ